MRKQGILAGIIVAVVLTLPTHVLSETLSDTLQTAYENSGLLDQNRALLRAADEDVAQAVGAMRPVINWSINATTTRPRTPLAPVVSTNARITGELLLYDFGASNTGAEVQKQLVLATRQSLRGVEQDVLLRAIQAYAGVRLASQFVALREGNLALIMAELRSAQQRFEVGEVTRTDVALAEARVASANSGLAAARGDQAQSVEEFIAAVGRRPGALAAIEPAPVSSNVADAKTFALRNHPSVIEAQLSVTVAELNIRRGEAAYRPSISLNGFVGLDQDLNDSAQLGVTASGPIYQGGRLSSQVRQLMSQRDAARAALLVTAQGIEQEVANSFAILQVSRAARQASTQQVDAAQRAFDGVRQEASLGSRTTLDVLNAEQELLDAEVNRISAQSDEIVASYLVLSSMGLLNTEHLRLPVQRYDPEAYYDLVKKAPTSDSAQGRALDRVLQAIGD